MQCFIKKSFFLMMWETHLHCIELLNGLCSAFPRRDCCLFLFGFSTADFFFPNTVIYPIIQMKHASCTTKSSGEMLCNSGSASKKHSSLHAVFWAAAALTDAVGLLDQRTYYRPNGISSNTICLLFMSHFVSKITKGPLEISGDLPKTSFFPSDFFF